MAVELPITLVPRAPVSSSGVGTTLSLEHDRFFAVVTLDVDAYAGDPDDDTLTVSVETAEADLGAWTELASVVITAVGAQVVKLVGCKARLRARWVVEGAAVVSFELAGTSYQTYSNNADLATLSLAAAALAGIAVDKQAEAVLAATDEAASYLAKGREMPILSWSRALRLHSSNMAVWHAMRARGFDPERDKAIRQGYEDALAWLKGAALTDPGIIDSDTTTSASSAYCVSRPERGWGHR